MTDNKALGDICHDAFWFVSGDEIDPKPSAQAWEAAANAVVDHAIEECFHDEQIRVWGEEFIGELAMIGHINPDTSYDDVIDVHRRFQSFMRDSVLPRIRLLKGEADA